MPDGSSGVTKLWIKNSVISNLQVFWLPERLISIFLWENFDDLNFAGAQLNCLEKNLLSEFFYWFTLDYLSLWANEYITFYYTKSFQKKLTVLLYYYYIPMKLSPAPLVFSKHVKITEKLV